MALFSTSEQDIVAALFAGLDEKPEWSTFLHRLRIRTKADHASLIIARRGMPVHEALQWYSGNDIRSMAKALDEFAVLDPTPYHDLKPGRVYAAMELIDPKNIEHYRFKQDYLRRLGVVHGRYMRVSAVGDMSAWLVVSRSKTEFTAADTAIISALAPYLTVALRLFAAFDEAHWRSAIVNNILNRAGIGWILFDDLLRQISMGGETSPYSGMGGEAESEILKVCKPIVDSLHAEGMDDARAVEVEGDRPLELLIYKAPKRGILEKERGATVVLVRHQRPANALQHSALSDLYGLTPSEAKLALALVQGFSLLEAAQSQGITIETARNYSKKIFDKMKSRGQVDSVRMILTSIVSLA